ncbi:MAG: Rieske 2Fe-2S domain-containing protein [Candidatus Thermoplasmatota archaeon]|nr:Rieske 2Fe-2S domain-containing protein [Candidatus Thermoplasmatota archaeon]MEC8242271.1 Rieske 2Fe-2S domain-containing protein [Candidatus Thermoplasmatota archaeon]MEC8249023.1 Rieske 2Fe-2S domain-containing protein [Candidatus Thermoplasmatota archaeon]
MSETENGQWRNALPVKKLKNGKKKMVTVDKKMILIGMHENQYFATEALCRHMRWPLAWGAKVEDDCIRCPLHQTTHKITDGELVEWSPFPLFPPYGKLVGKMSKQKNLTIYETRVDGSQVQVFF